MGAKKNTNAQKSKKITEKQFLRMMVSSVCSILLCLACLISTTWAWFSLDISSEGNEIQVGTFSIDLLVKRTQAGEAEEVVLPSTENSYLLSPGTYAVEIHASGNSTAGHCLVKLDGNTYKTFGIYSDGLRFNVLISVPAEASTTDGFVSTLSIVPVWGKPTSDAMLSEGKTISNTAGLVTDDPGVAGQQDPTNPQDATDPEQTTDPEQITDPEQTTTPEETTNPQEPTQPETPSEEASE